MSSYHKMDEIISNERITEELVRTHFKEDPLFQSVKLEEQKSYNNRIIGLLQTASKSGKGIGKPEFIISFPSGNIDYLIVIECKASVANHRSAKLDNPKDYAVDGVLHYAKMLSAEFDVVAIAVSGQTHQELHVSNFVWKKDEPGPTENKEDQKLLSISNYLKLFNNEQFADNLRNVDIIQKAIFLNDECQAYSITEMTRCTIVSAVLLSLLHEPFRVSYKTYPTSESLGKAMLSAIESILMDNNTINTNEMLGEYGKILNEPLFKQKTIKYNKKSRESSVEVVKKMIGYLHQNIYPLMDMEQSGVDVLGKFYTEFIRYSGKEKGQGLVLTPTHITDLFCDLANITTNDIIYDPCCGTGGFLIAGMKRMFELAGNDENKKQNIRSKQLIGVEIRPAMFTYACSNMMMRGDGRSNIYRGDCFEFDNNLADQHKPTVAFLNPPYNGGTIEQMKFIEHALNAVSEQNGRVVAIVQMNCSGGRENELIAIKKRILSRHHLKAVLSMPDELFYPVSVVTCVMVFEAGKKHKGRESWFGYFKDDKFEKRKNKGRIDVRGLYKSEKERWLHAYHNSKEVAGLSVKKEVNAEDEWCAEAYMGTDYSTLCDNNFIKKMRDYAAFLFLNNNDLNTVFELTPASNKKLLLNSKDWKSFKYDEVFDVSIGKSYDLNVLTPTEEQNGINYVCRTEINVKNGVETRVLDELPINAGNVITVVMVGKPATAFYQKEGFICSQNILILSHRKLNSFNSMFICSLIELEKYRFSYGRTLTKGYFVDHEIKLPATPEGTPDWKFMEDYIKSLPYSRII